MASLSSELGTLFFAIINIAVVAFSCATSVGSLIFWCTLSFPFPKNFGSRRDALGAGTLIVYLAIIFAWMIFSFVCLLFSSFLLNGIIKKKPEHIKAYFVFGVIIAVLSFMLLVSAVIFEGYDAVINPGTYIFMSAYLIYCLILNMINHTYRNMELSQELFKHKPLKENC